MAKGYIYILINSALPGSVKIGKTTRLPEDRAKELSTATGIPTPFIVAYDDLFEDCDAAELYIHNQLENRGLRTSSNREFFLIPLKEAISVVMDAKIQLISGNSSFLNSDLSNSLPTRTGTNSINDEPVWQEPLDQGVAYYEGYGDCIEDREKAVSLFKQATRLGSHNAYICLSEAAADAENTEEGIRWLKRGAEAGAYGCWLELAMIFMGKNYAYDLPVNLENARKAFRNFFRQIDIEHYFANYPYSPYTSEDGNQFFFILKNYVDISINSQSNNDDSSVITDFCSKFSSWLSFLPHSACPEIKISELDQLLSSKSSSSLA